MTRLGDDQDRIQAALQACDPKEDEVGPEEGSLVVGWVVVVEWMGTDGERWLVQLTNPTCVAWQRQGYLHNALNMPWGGE